MEYDMLPAILGLGGFFVRDLWAESRVAGSRALNICQLSAAPAMVVLALGGREVCRLVDEFAGTIGPMSVLSAMQTELDFAITGVVALMAIGLALGWFAAGGRNLSPTTIAFFFHLAFWYFREAEFWAVSLLPLGIYVSANASVVLFVPRAQRLADEPSLNAAAGGRSGEPR